MMKKVVITGLVMSVLFAGQALLFRGFVLDDAYITYRYAGNLRRTGTIVWNVGEDPVEGFTSFLWVVLNAGAISAGIDPVIFSKAVSLTVALGVIWLLTLAGRNGPWPLTIIFVAAVALNPAFAFLAMQGMETALTTFLLLISALLAIQVVSRPGVLIACAWFGFALLGFLSRPDTSLFNFGIFLGSVFVMARKGEKRALGAFLLCAVFFVILFLLYEIWRLAYFGYLFPNTFFIKLSTGGRLVKGEGVRYAGSFIVRILLPYLVLVAVLGRKHLAREKLLKVFPVLLGSFLFFCYIPTIVPIQGFLWRFIFPVYPAILLCALFYFEEMPVSRSPLGRKSVCLLLVAFFVLWTVKDLPAALRERENRPQFDRAAVGRALSGLRGTMFITESGALPYYSGWKAVDFLGLNSEEIAHHGLSYELMDSLEPDLVMVLERTGYYGKTARFRIINRYMTENGFVAVAAIHQAGSHYSFYFVRADSALFAEIVSRLEGVEEVERGNLSDRMLEKRIPVY